MYIFNLIQIVQCKESLYLPRVHYRTPLSLPSTGRYFLCNIIDEKDLILICMYLIIIAVEHLFQLFAILLLRFTFFYSSAAYSLHYLFEILLKIIDIKALAYPYLFTIFYSCDKNMILFKSNSCLY